jgi:hypothetical protein
MVATSPHVIEWLYTGFGLVIGFVEFRISVTHSKCHSNYNTYSVFLVFSSRCSVAASKGGRFLSSVFENDPKPTLPKTMH